MEALSTLKFWKPTPTKIAVDGEYDDRDTVPDSTVSDPLTDDDDDDFFELELSLPKFNSDSPNPTKPDLTPDPKITSKPQSPISILRSASPKLRVFIFGKLKKKPRKEIVNNDEFYDTESNSSSFSPKSDTNNSLFTVKFKIEDGSIVPKFTRTNSSKTASFLSSPKSLLQRQSPDESSKRFPKKYLNFVKPLYMKRSGDGGGGERIAVCSPMRCSMASFPSPRKEEKQSSRFNLKQLGKSKSASAMVVPSSQVIFPARNDHPCENIEGAILHCKRSLTSAIEHSSLSRCSSDPSHEKTIQVSEDL